MWTEASILFMFAVGMTLLYLGLERLVPALAAPLLSARRRAAAADTDGAHRFAAFSPRDALLGLALALLGVLSVYYAVAQLR